MHFDLYRFQPGSRQTLSRLRTSNVNSESADRLAVPHPIPLLKPGARLLRLPKTEPIKFRRPRDFAYDFQSCILKVKKGASSGLTARDHCIGNAFASFVIVLVWRGFSCKRNPKQRSYLQSCSGQTL